MRLLQWGTLAVVVLHAAVRPIQAALDPAFGVFGGVSFIVIETCGGFPPPCRTDSRINAIDVTADGEIVAAGYADRVARGSTTFAALVRYQRDGRVDPSFNNGSAVLVAEGSEDGFTDVAVQRDGKIVVARQRLSGESIIHRYDEGGRPDLTFGNNGELTVPGALRFDVQDDGTIVAIGRMFDGSDLVGFRVSRFEPGWQVDQSFGAGGSVEGTFGTGRNVPTEIVAQPDGRIVVGGISDADAVRLAVTRYRPNGSLDEDFGDRGTARISSDKQLVRAMALLGLPDGGVVLAGTVFEPTGSELSLYRLDEDGQPVVEFGNGGRASTSVRQSSRPCCLLADDRGGIVVAGTWGPSDGFVLARFGLDGIPDTGFGADGILVTAPSTAATPPGPETPALAFALAQQPDGKLIVAGEAQRGSGSLFTLVRYDLEPPPTPTATATLTPAPDTVCVGDCNDNHIVTVGEIVRGVNLALGAGNLSECPQLDVDRNGRVTVNELIAAVQRALSGCGSEPMLPRMIGRYTGTTSQTTTGCEDPEDDDFYTYVDVPIEINISAQEGPSFSGTGSIGDTQLTLAAVVDERGGIRDGTFSSLDGSGTFSGTVTDGRMQLSYAGQDFPQVDSCRYTGSIDVSLAR